MAQRLYFQLSIVERLVYLCSSYTVIQRELLQLKQRHKQATIIPATAPPDRPEDLLFNTWFFEEAGQLAEGVIAPFLTVISDSPSSTIGT